ncbi:MAG: methylated-DNA--[protein]-cysteine S-methyltransferase [Planctomycetales bacterium]
MTKLDRDWKFSLFLTDLGWMGMLGSEHGLRRVSIGNSNLAAAKASLCDSVEEPSSEEDWDPELRRRLKAFAIGTQDDFLDVRTDLQGFTKFQHQVLDKCRKIPFGSRLTYGRLAAKAGSPKAARAVGSVMANNPIPLVIPCHRVVAANGLGGFSAPSGLRLKKRLLALEAGTMAGGDS